MKYFIILTGLLLIGCSPDKIQFTQLSDLEDSPFQEALESRVELETAEDKIGRKKGLTTEPGQVGGNAFKGEQEGTAAAETAETETVITDETELLVEADVDLIVTVKGSQTATVTGIDAATTATTAATEAAATASAEAEVGTQPVETPAADDDGCDQDEYIEPPKRRGIGEEEERDIKKKWISTFILDWAVGIEDSVLIDLFEMFIVRDSSLIWKI